MRRPQLFKRLLKQAVDRFGPLDNTWKLEAITIGARHPQVIKGSKQNTYTVRLSASTDHQRTYQLAHEAVHCLAPAIRLDTIWFEEGLANEFALTLRDLPVEYRAEAERTLPKILRDPLIAFRAVSPSDDQIKAMRAQQLRFDDFTPELIQRHTRATAEQATVLCQRLPNEDRSDQLS